ncbi:MAG: serine/threonine-protein kinase, partial [Myxococcota bacterium]
MRRLETEAPSGIGPTSDAVSGVASDRKRLEVFRSTVPAKPGGHAPRQTPTVSAVACTTVSAGLGAVAAPASMPAQIGKYQLIRELGRGGMGAVFLARDTRLARLVAIKFLHLSDQAGGEAAQRFIGEARTTARCRQDNIVVIHEADELDGTPYMVLEYLEGRTLRQVLTEQAARHTAEVQIQAAGTAFTADDPGDARAGLAPERAIEIIIPVIRALEHAHDMGIVHRDLKPENVMLTRAGTIKVLDFGIARVLADSELSWPDELPERLADPVSTPRAMTRASALMGTLPYMSPEQLTTAHVDHRTDLWAVGIMLFEMVLGRHPLEPLSVATLQEVAELDVPMPRVGDLCPGIGILGAIIDRCLIKDRDHRTASARALLAELAPLSADQRALALGVDECPFAGLAAFQESDADRFFGRAGDIASTVARVRGEPLVAVIGPSGVGKSSLVRAGVIPALKRS